MGYLSECKRTDYAVICALGNIFAQSLGTIRYQSAGEHAIGEGELHCETEVITEDCLTEGQH